MAENSNWKLRGLVVKGPMFFEQDFQGEGGYQENMRCFLLSSMFRQETISDQ